LKKRLISLLLFIALLPVGSVFGAGTAGDPLISRSYLEGTFIPEMYSALKVMLSEAVEEALSQRSASTGTVKKHIKAEGSITLHQGAPFILLSGSVRLEPTFGPVVDVTEGVQLAGGELTVGHRYIVCENSAAKLSIKRDSLLLISTSAQINEAEEAPLVSPFADVVAGVWWHDDIVRAYNRGLVNGMTATTFEPKGSLTVSQTIKLAACMHQLYHEGAVSLQNSPQQPWYQSYVDYCIENGIISGAFSNYGATATRRLFVEIFSAALPESEYEPINTIPTGSIGDIQSTGEWVDAVYTFYRAGLLTGYTQSEIYDAHDFGPESSITRAEVATIMNRMFDPSARVSFTID